MDEGNIQPGNAPETAQSDRLDALLEERFRSADKLDMERQIADHDRQQGQTFDKAHVRRKLRFYGDIPDKVRQAVEEWLVGMLAFAADRGIRLRDLNHEIHFFDPPTYALKVTELPPGLKLPAASHGFNQLYRIYTVRVVMPHQLEGTGQLLAVLRAVLGRLLGDIYLREEIFSREIYREDIPPEKDNELSIGLAEKIDVLAETPNRHKRLDILLDAYAKEIHLNYKRVPDQVKKAFYQKAAKDFEAQKLSDLWAEVIGETFEQFLNQQRADIPSALIAAVAEAEEKNRQLNFLPPDELPDYEQLRRNNPLHYLRASRLREGCNLITLRGSR